MGSVLIGCLFAAGIPALLAVIMFLMAYLVRKTGDKCAEGCTVAVVATIINLRAESEPFNYVRKQVYKYIPTYSYFLNGQNRMVEDIVGFSEEDLKQYKVGMQVELMVNPQDPSCFKLAGQTEHRMKIWLKVGYFFVGLAVVLFVLTFIACVFL